MTWLIATSVVGKEKIGLEIRFWRNGNKLYTQKGILLCGVLEIT
jgi:hypothetical protein